MPIVSTSCGTVHGYQGLWHHSILNAMYSTCLHCHRALGRNEAIEEFPIGRRLAFDAAKGRLWAVCGACGRWNLSPIEERWEAVESCERVYRTRKLRAQTDNIGLARLADGTDLIRIGMPLRPEFAAWRYGGVFRRRLHKRIAIMGGVGAAAAAGGLLVAGAPILATIGPLAVMPFIHVGIASIALRGNIVGTSVVGEDGKALRVMASNLDHTKIIFDDDGAFRLHLRHSYGHQVLTGARATRALATLLARANRGGGSTSTIRAASEMIADAGDPRRAIECVAREAQHRTGDFEEYAAEVARAPRARTMVEAYRALREIQGRRPMFNGVQPVNPGALHRLPAVSRLALEMSLHETSEQHALDEELAELERAWREAEEIAAIADAL
jgi:hypothetical protein